MKLDELLAVHLALLAGCAGAPDALLCQTAPDVGHQKGVSALGRDVGYLAVDSGDPCPPVAEVTHLGTDQCCPALSFQGAVCGFVRRDEDQVHVNTGYGGYWTSADAASAIDTGTVSEPSDVCFYEAIFHVGDTCCGRPLLREGAPIVAAPGGAGWADGARPDVGGLPADARRALGAYWAQAAFLEHASVASFARFTLDLVAHGAPPDLVARAQQAGLDEVAHARLCFSLASAYAGREIGPAAMDLAGITLAPTFRALAEAVAREGCVGETLAAVDAAARLAQATDPAVAAALRQIVAEEARHAALAWDTLRWILARDPAVAPAIDAAFAERSTPPDDGPAPPAGAAAHGLLDPAWRARILEDAWAKVVEPAYRALRR